MLKLFLTDLLAASLSTVLMFGLGYYFAHQIEASFDQVKHWLTAIVGLTLTIWLFSRYYRERQRAGQPVGPPVLVTDDVPLPPDDLHAHHPHPPAPVTAPPALIDKTRRDDPREGQARRQLRSSQRAGRRPG